MVTLRDEWYRRFSWRRVLAILGVVTVLDLACYLALVRPSLRATQDRDTRIATMTADVAQARSALEALQGRAGRLDALDREGIELVQQIALPRKSAFSDLLTELGAASQNSGIEMRETSYAIAPLEDNEEYGLLAVDATFRGEYADLIRFLHHLDRAELFFIISSLGATPRGEDDLNELQISIRFDTLVRDL